MQTSEVRPASAAALEADRARALLQLSALLAPFVQEGDTFAGQFAALERQFFQACRMADYLLALPDAPEDQIGSDGQDLEDFLQKLRQENRALAQTPLLEQLRGQAEAAARAGGGETGGDTPATRLLRLPEHGTPHSWHATSEAVAPPVQLHAEEAIRDRQALIASLLLTLGIVGAWLLSYYPATMTQFRRFWPEQVIVLGLLGWWLAGTHPGVFVCLAVGVVARVVILGRSALRWLLHSATPPSSRAPRVTP
jgi:hypothetical protein